MNKWIGQNRQIVPIQTGDWRSPKTGLPSDRPACASTPGRMSDGTDWGCRALVPTLIVLAVGLVGLLILFKPTAAGIAQAWWEKDAYGHGLFVVPISVFLIWRARRRLARIAPRPSVWGLVFLALAAVAWLLGKVAGVLVVEQFSFVFMVQALVLTIVGWRLARAALFPLFFLLFAVPFGEFLIPPLQEFTARFTVHALQVSGIPVFLDGLFIQIPGATFEVAAACSGARFLITSVVLGTLVASQFYQQLWRRALCLLLSALLPIIANGFRAYGLVMIAHLSGLELAVGADHLTFGLIFLAVVIALLLLTASLFREKGASLFELNAVGEVEPATTEKAPRLANVAGTAIVALMVAGSMVAYAPVIENRGREQAGSIALMPPRIGADWQQVADTHSGWRPKFYGAAQEKLWYYAKGDQRIEVYAAFYPYQSQDSEIVGWRNRLADGKIWQQLTTVDRTRVTLGGKAHEVQRIYLRSGSSQRLVLFWYWIDGRFEADPRIAKLLQLKTQLLGGNQSAAVIAIATDYSDMANEAMRRLQSFLAEAPAFDSIVTGDRRKIGAKIAAFAPALCRGGEPCAE